MRIGIRRGCAAFGSVAVPRPDLELLCSLLVGGLAPRQDLFVCIGSEVGSSARYLAMYI